MDHRRIGARRAIRETDVPCALLRGMGQQRFDPREQCARSGVAHADFQRAREVHRAGMHIHAGMDGLMRGFSRYEALVDIGGAALNETIHADPLAGAHQHELAGLNRGGGHFLQHAIGQDACHGFRAQAARFEATARVRRIIIWSSTRPISKKKMSITAPSK